MKKIITTKWTKSGGIRDIFRHKETKNNEKLENKKYNRKFDHLRRGTTCSHRGGHNDVQTKRTNRS